MYPYIVYVQYVYYILTVSMLCKFFGLEVSRIELYNVLLQVIHLVLRTKATSAFHFSSL